MEKNLEKNMCIYIKHIKMSHSAISTPETNTS